MDSPPYDVFISHSTPDRAWVQEVLLTPLEGQGYQVCVGYRDFRQGFTILDEIERGILQSRKTLLVVTPAYLTELWSTLEPLLPPTAAAVDDQQRVLVVLREPCVLPPRLAACQCLEVAESTGAVDVATWLQRVWEPMSTTPAPPVSAPQQTAVGSCIAQAINGTAVVTVYQWVREQPADPQVVAAAQALLAQLPTDVLPDVAVLPPGSRMPFARNALFVGCEADLCALAQALKDGATVAIGQIAAATGWAASARPR